MKNKRFIISTGNKVRLLASLGLLILWFNACKTGSKPEVSKPGYAVDSSGNFLPPDTATIPHDEFGEMVRYGRELMVRTAYYLGPNGTKGHYLGNKMNCTNCHLDAGTRPYGFNFFSTHARYPQYRGREDQILTLPQRVNNCIERPHNGVPMPLDSKEMVAMVSYIKWLGGNVPVGQHVKGDEALELKYPERKASPQNGAILFKDNCAVCHGE